MKPIEIKLDMQAFERRVKTYFELLDNYREKNLSLPEIARLEQVTLIFCDPLDFGGKSDDECVWEGKVICINSILDEEKQQKCFFKALADILTSRGDVVQAFENGHQLKYFYGPKPK